MGKNNKKKAAPPPESLFHILHHASSSSSRAIVDTHTHLASTFEAYRAKYPAGRGLYAPAGVEAMVDVWCEAPVRPIWKEFADAALRDEERAEKWGGVDYWFVMGVHPHEARLYDDAVEADILEAMTHPRCVGWGEIGLDYHYDNSPRPVQQAVFARQLRHAVRLGKPLTIHTREADEDTERILKEGGAARTQDPHPLLHRLARLRAKAAGLVPEFVYWDYRCVRSAIPSLSSLPRFRCPSPCVPVSACVACSPRWLVSARDPQHVGTSRSRHPALPAPSMIAIGRDVRRALGLAHDNLQRAPGAAPPALTLALPMHTASEHLGAWLSPSCVVMTSLRRYQDAFIQHARQPPYDREWDVACTAARAQALLLLRVVSRARGRAVAAATLMSATSERGRTLVTRSCVITYTSNTDTSTAVRNMFASPPSSTPSASTPNASETSEADEDKKLRILLETDAPYMVPAPIYTSAPFVDGEGKGEEVAAVPLGDGALDGGVRRGVVGADEGGAGERAERRWGATR
ncbi:hypothetical protein MSAN_00171900 [Mycena sanguinolenta]|uniref:Metallo-dependent hydrolase n=1 Tax=Mycena sanguinolenta TaxID=230812 RepID=A0A8H7DJB0_9AGAR|nr:hypothetical protein MSAN_00171900 [Mycena sanguinolenta]